MGVEVVALVADHHELAGLVGGDQQRRAELPQQRGEVRRVGGLQRAGVFRLGEAGPGVGLSGAPGVLKRSRPFGLVESGIWRAAAVCVVMFFLHWHPKEPGQEGRLN